MSIFKKLFDTPIRRSEVELTRNEPCWCGSGEKYKRCHMEKDLERERREAAACRRYS